MLGILWALRHLPIFLVPTLAWPETRGLIPFILIVTSEAIIITWVYNKTGGSLLMTILTHAALKAGTFVIAQFTPLTNTAGYYLAECLSVTFAALLVIILTRGRLGYVAPLVPTQSVAASVIEHVP